MALEDVQGLIWDLIHLYLRILLLKQGHTLILQVLFLCSASFKKKVVLLGQYNLAVCQHPTT